MTKLSRRKILLVIEASGGGVGRHVIDLARELDKQGHNVHLVYSGLRMEAGFRGDLGALGRVKTHRVDMRRSPHPVDIAAALRIRNYIAGYGPFDFIHGHSSKGGALVRFARIGLPGYVIYTPHAFRTLDPLLRPLLRWLYKTIEKGLGYLTDGFILVSEDEKTHAISLGLAPEKLYVVANGITRQVIQSRVEARRQLGLDSNKVYIGFIGRFVPQKNPEGLIEAFAGLASQFESAYLLLLGDGPLSASLHSLAARLGITDRIVWMTDITGSAVMHALDMFVMPSRYEAFPYVLLEAAAAELPIVATPVGGTSALVSDNVNGFLVSPDQPDMLDRALRKLLENPALRHKMGQASKAIVQSYTVEAMTERTLKVYSDVMNRDSGTASEINLKNRDQADS